MASLAWAAIIKIPVCGGYLADTNAPEDTCFGRFSNEETVPQPCLRGKTCRAFFEHNLVLRSFGRMGFQWAERRRAPIMLSAFIVSTIGWAFTIAACVAYTSTDDDAVRATYWGWGDVDNGSVLYFVGLRRLLFKGGAMDGGGRELEALTWGGDSDGVCGTNLAWRSKTNGGEVVESLNGLPVASCGSCEKAVNGIIQLVVVSCITQVFQMTTDLQRTTRYGDMNCQKLFGCATSLYGFGSTFATLTEFRTACGLRHTLPPWFKTSRVAVSVVSNSARASVEVSFFAGPGYVLLLLAVLLKAYDALCHLAVPCPEPNSWPVGDPRADSGKESSWNSAAASAAAAAEAQPHAAGSELSELSGEGRVSHEALVAGKDHWTELSHYMRLSTEAAPPLSPSSKLEMVSPTNGPSSGEGIP